MRLDSSTVIGVFNSLFGFERALKGLKEMGVEPEVIGEWILAIRLDPRDRGMRDRIEGVIRREMGWIERDEKALGKLLKGVDASRSGDR